jgi:glycosyltransferase involved in cell wall biosynthesis
MAPSCAWSSLGVLYVREPGPAAPRFTLVTASYDVERYLEDFIASIEAQTFPLERVQVVVVDDGSRDRSSDIAHAWRDRRPELVSVVSQSNRGISSARNAGLLEARGEWVSFPDPDDMLTPGYLREVDAFIEAHPEARMVAARRVVHLEASQERLPHTLDAHFLTGNRVRDLCADPDFFHGAVNTAFFPLHELDETGLRFDERVRPHFEDGHFSAHYLLRQDRPLVGFVSSAEYLYRKRADLSSTLDRSRSDPGRYSVVLEHGYLDVLRQAKDDLGAVPEWLQTFVLYELSWYFQGTDAATRVPIASLRGLADDFHRCLGAIVALLDPEVISSFAVRPLDPVWREALLHAYDAQAWHSEHVLVSKLDPLRHLVRVTYRHTGPRPTEQFLSDGEPVLPAFEKTRAIDYFDRVLLHERIVWLPSGTLQARLDGRSMPVTLSDPQIPRFWMSMERIRHAFLPRLVRKNRERARVAAAARSLSLADRAVVRLARTRLVRRYYGNAWVLIDRIENADDSAEVLFRYLRRHRRGKNAWFVIRRGTPDHRRLRADGYKRIVSFGSLRWRLLMLNCRHLISSHVDVPIHQPPEILRLGPPRWRFTFLQHGVMKDDLSGWLNPKDLDLFITSTPGEHESVVADGSPYRYGKAETVLTGLPRFDALLAAGERVPPAERDLLLVAPTWRTWMRVPGTRTTIGVEEFLRTEFATQWLALVTSDELSELAGQQGLQVALLLHPDLQPFTDHLNLPDHVRACTFAGRDVRDTFAHARVLVTDYSSMSFNAAYIDRPVVYFQFDRERVFGGEHLGRPGYFDYERDGFGPVATTLEDALTAIRTTVLAGPHPLPEYAARTGAAFPDRDGHCTERVFAAIRDSVRPVPRVTAPEAGPGRRRVPGPRAAGHTPARPPLQDSDQTVERSRPSQ